MIPDPLSEALDVEFEIDEVNEDSLEDEQSKEIILSQEPPKEQHKIEDYNIVRSTLHNLIVEGLTSVTTLSKIAAMSNSDKAYSALAKLIDSVNTTTTNLKELHNRTNQEPTRTTDKQEKETTVFVGSPSDFLKYISGKKQENETEIQ